MRKFRVIPALVLLLAATACAPRTTRAQRASDNSVAADTVDRVTAGAAAAAMSGMTGQGMHDMHDMHMSANPHMQMTALRPANAADSARAASLVREMRTDLARYKDVRAAIADGFQQFLPNVPQPVYHFTNWRWAFAEAFRFDPARPGSLLYRKNADGSFTLVGAMYTAPRSVAEARLDERIPLSVAQWHQHVNWCLPPKGAEGRWIEHRDGKPVFGPDSPIATEAACNAVGGRFAPHVFGWMVHVNVFDPDPRRVWAHAD